MFCLQRKVLAEANYDLLNFMYTRGGAVYRINRNRALISGDGVNEPQGWMSANCFTNSKTGAVGHHIDFRIFYASCPVEYGPVVATMHQNMFAHLPRKPTASAASCSATAS